MVGRWLKEVSEYEDRDCPICGGSSTSEQVPQNDMFRHECPHCGRFEVAGLTSDTLPGRIMQNPALRIGLPLHIQEANERGETPELDAFFIDEAFTRGTG